MADEFPMKYKYCTNNFDVMTHRGNGFWSALRRRKPVDQSFESPLRRCLVFWDLFLLGVGGSVDVGLYVVLGDIIRDFCGPAVVIALVLGFLVCFGTGLCYAEFASYTPTSGSDYDYVYATLGELWGFFDGWSVLVSSIIATASLAQGAANLLSSLTNSATFDHLDSHVVLLKHALFASNLNIAAALILTLVTFITAVGVQSSIRFNDFVVLVNLSVIIFTIILGLFYADIDNWSSWDKFAPYRVTGILKALPYTVFLYGGFVAVTYSSEEVINPSILLPRSLIASLVGIFLLYMAAGSVLSLVMPYHRIPKASPLSNTFGIVSFKASKYIIAFGGFCACYSSVMTASYSNSRLAYVMSRDGLIIKYLGKVNARSLVPVRAVVITGIVALVLAAFLDLTILIEMCSILTVVPYVLLCIAVITLRYNKGLENNRSKARTDDNTEHSSKQSDEAISTNLIKEPTVHVPPESVEIKPKTKTKFTVKMALIVLVLSASGLSLAVRFGISLQTIIFIPLVVVFSVPLLISVLVICKTPCQRVEFPFTVPCFPLVPAFCLALCCFLMLQFSMWAWILFGINTVFGLIIYFCYGIKHSKVVKTTAAANGDTENETESI